MVRECKPRSLGYCLKALLDKPFMRLCRTNDAIKFIPSKRFISVIYIHFLSSSLFQNGAIFGPFFICPFLIFSGFFIHLTDAHASLHWLFHISFLKYALEGATLAIFGYDRSKLKCSEMFCMFHYPKDFLKSIDMYTGSYTTAIIALSIIFLLFRCIAFGVMYLRLGARR